MSKKILVISTSLRKESNSDMLAEAFMNGARETGHEVETVSLKTKPLGFVKAVWPVRKQEAVLSGMMLEKLWRKCCMRMYWYLPHPFTTMR